MNLEETKKIAKEAITKGKEAIDLMKTIAPPDHESDQEHEEVSQEMAEMLEGIENAQTVEEIQDLIFNA